MLEKIASTTQQTVPLYHITPQYTVPPLMLHIYHLLPLQELMRNLEFAHVHTMQILFFRTVSFKSGQNSYTLKAL